MLAYLNGKIMPRAKAVISIDDHGFLYGDGIYETLRVYNGEAFQLKEHFKRLQHSATGIGLKLPFALSGFVKAIQQTVRANKQTEAVVRLTVTRGPGPYGFDPRPCKNPTVAIISYPFKPYPVGHHTQGVIVGIVSIRRNNPKSLPPHVKSTSCMNGILAKMESIKLGAFEGVMLTHDGFLAEGTVSNVFVVKNGVLKTPALEGTLLAGVTRDYILKLAKRLRIPIRETRLRRSDLAGADEMFLSNTTMEVMPIRRLVGEVRRKVGGPGPLTRSLMGAFRNARLPAL